MSPNVAIHREAFPDCFPVKQQTWKEVWALKQVNVYLPELFSASTEQIWHQKVDFEVSQKNVIFHIIFEGQKSTEYHRNAIKNISWMRSKGF